MLPAMESQASETMNSGLEVTLPPGQGPVPTSPDVLAGRKKTWKRKWAEQSQLCDLRLDLMQKQLEEMHKTIDCMVTHQQHLLDVSHQAPPFLHPHSDVLSLTASDKFG